MNRERVSSWYLIICLCSIIIVAQGMILTHLPELGSVDIRTYARIVHLIMAVTIGLYTFKTRKTWNKRKATTLFIFMYLPFYYFIWFIQADSYNTELLGLPLRGFYFHFFVLSFLVPGSYIVNLILLTFFVIEAACAWVYFDFAHHPNVGLSLEPKYSILFAIISFALLAFHYREEYITKKKFLKEAKNEVLEKWAQIILSIRDRANSPLQTLNIAFNMLKRKDQIDTQTLTIVENALEKLNAMSELLKKVEAKVEWDGRELMSDEEIMNWFKEDDSKS